MTDTAEIESLRQEVVHLVKMIAPWIGMTRKLSLEQLCAMFGWSDPRLAMVYFNPSVTDLANALD